MSIEYAAIEMRSAAATEYGMHSKQQRHVSATTAIIIITLINS